MNNQFCLYAKYHIANRLEKSIGSLFTQKRYLNKKQILQKTAGNIKKASEYFDKVYPDIYGEAWTNIRTSLLQEHKYVAICNNFSEYDTFAETIEKVGAFEIGSFYKDLCLNRSKEQDLGFEISKPGSNEEVTDSLIKQNLNTFANKSDIAEGKLQFDSYSDHLLYNKEPDERRKLDEASIGSDANYVHSNKFKGLEEWTEEIDVFKSVAENDQDIKINKITQEEPLEWPGLLKSYVYVLGDHSEFPEPYSWKQHQLHTFYLVNGASILPVLALDLKPNDKVLDMCAAPGGKSLMMLQTGLLDYLECNDLSISRNNRLRSVMDKYIPKDSPTRKRLDILTSDGRAVTSPQFFDKVLVDAPCLCDRQSLTVNDNNLFKTSRLKERLRLPELQAQLIVSAIHSVKPGGSVVYSTCTLSPFQNDGAVYLALCHLMQTSVIRCTIVDLSKSLKHLQSIFKFGRNIGLRYGHLVVPSENRNFGPMYFCKIIRNEE